MSKHFKALAGARTSRPHERSHSNIDCPINASEKEIPVLDSRELKAELYESPKHHLVKKDYGLVTAFLVSSDKLKQFLTHAKVQVPPLDSSISGTSLY
jgi:hypothetical protein